MAEASPDTRMLPLDSPGWRQLQTAYGDADEIPGLLAELRQFPKWDSYRSEPWFSLWSALCHQGDVYTASFAAVPHIIAALANAPERAYSDYFLLPACIELARFDKGLVVPVELDSAYCQALYGLPELAAQAAKGKWSDDMCASAMAAFAISMEKYELARLLIEIDPGSYRSVVENFMNN